MSGEISLLNLSKNKSSAKNEMMLLKNILIFTIALSLVFVLNAFKVLPKIGLPSSSKRYLFGNPEPSKDAAPAKKDGGLFGQSKFIEVIPTVAF